MIDLASLDPNELRRALEQTVKHTKSNIAHFVVERETALTALSELQGEEFAHYENTIAMYENEILFNQKKLAAAEARLAELDD